LFTRISRVGTSVQERSSIASSRTAFWLERSSLRARYSTVGKLSLSASMLSWILEALRPAMMSREGD
jgi:hypothetical protein